MDTPYMELPPDNPGGRVTGMLDSVGVNCLAKAVAISVEKSVAISPLLARDLEEKVKGLLEVVSPRFSLRDLIMLYRRERLHLCEHDSTVWVYFC